MISLNSITFLRSCKCLDLCWNTCSNTFNFFSFTTHHARPYKHCLGYTFIYKEYTGINMFIITLDFVFFKSYVISGKKTTTT